jgi:tetratricopeptide (TPR) repeat protein
LRDDLSVELCALYNQTGAPEKARKILSTRNFQPWEGGEGQALGQHVRTHLALGRRALTEGDGATAVSRFEEALQLPLNLAEAKHLLANQSDIHYWLGEAFEKTGDIQRARQHWKTAAAFRGDFQSMSVRAFSEMTYFSALAWKRLGKPDRAKSMFNELLAYARDLQKQIAKIDYFATSLPTMLLFDEDIQAVQVTTALFLQGQALLGLGRKSQALALAAEVLRRAPNHALASDLLRP